MNYEYLKLRDAMLTIMNMSDVEFNAMWNFADGEGPYKKFGCSEVDDTMYGILCSERLLRTTEGFVCRTVEQLEHRGLFEGAPL